jgi:hypothetical protein
MWYHNNNMNSLRKRLRFLSLTGLVMFLLTSYSLLLTPISVSAQTTPSTPAAPTQYKLLAPLPLDGAGGKETNETTAMAYIRGLFMLIIGIAGGLAVVMIIYGGITYMSTDAFSGKETAKGIIENAIWGLLLAIGAWIILYTINPALVNLDLKIDPVKVSTSTPSGGGGGTGGGGTLPGYPLTQEQVAQSNAVRSNLELHKPPVLTYRGPCVAGQTKGCVNLVDLPQGAVDGLKKLASGCQADKKVNCFVLVTGGTEGGHKTHGPNRAQVDIDKNMTLNSYIMKKENELITPNPNCSQLGKQYRVNGAIYVDEGNHWHICY